MKNNSLSGLGQVVQGRLDLLHLGEPGVADILDVADANGQSITVVVAETAVVLGFRELGRFLETKNGRTIFSSGQRRLI